MQQVFNYISFLEETLKIICENVHAEAGAIFYLDQSKSSLVVKKAYGEKSKYIENSSLPITKGICGYVAKTGQAVIVHDTKNDPRFNEGIDLKTGFHTSSILAIPLKYSNKTIGVLELCNKKGEKFSDRDFHTALEMAAQAAISLQFASYIEEIELYNRFNKHLTESLSGGLIGFDISGQIITFNYKGAGILQLTRPDVINKNFREAFSNYPEIVNLIDTLIKNQQPEIRSMIQIKTKDGKTINMGYSKVLIQDEQGKIIGGSISFQNLK